MVTSKLPPERDRISIGLLLVTDGSFHFNPFVTNGLSHPYHLDEPTSIFGGIGIIFDHDLRKQNSPRLNAAFLRRRPIWGYFVCLCPIKRTTGLYGLSSIARKYVFEGFRPGQTQTSRYSDRRWLEALNFGYKRNRDVTM